LLAYGSTSFKADRADSTARSIEAERELKFLMLETEQAVT